ncbi:MAG: phytanoyl-CoA dioxygenase family protein [Caldilineaceae bacterium]|jgi:ectoine hydroxylase-related dioxygenase (phytanoyl-CoA dioxygenase family)
MLSQQQLDFYNTNSYLLVKGVFTKAEAAHFRQEAHDIINRLSAHASLDATWGAARQTSDDAKKTAIYHCHNVQFYSAALTRLISDERFTAIAAGILGTENVQLHHNKLFIKPSEKGSPFPMHQDAPFFPHHNHSMIAGVVHFDDAPIEKGCIRVVPGSHKLGMLEHLPEGGWHLPFSQYPIESAVPCPAEAGDVLFFSYLTIHGSGINVSNEARTTLLVQMRDPMDPPVKLAHLSRGQGMMLRGIDPSGRHYPMSEADAVKAQAPAMGMGMGEPAMGAMGMGGMGEAAMGAKAMGM